MPGLAGARVGVSVCEGLGYGKKRKSDIVEEVRKAVFFHGDKGSGGWTLT